MSSLFVKTLLWFLATMTVAIVGMTVTTAMTFRVSESRQSPFNKLLRVEVEDAKHAYESGGPQALAAAMARLNNVNDADAVFTDSEGRDLVSGELRPDLKKRLLQPRRRPGPIQAMFGFNRPPLIAHPDSTRKYWLFLNNDARGGGSMFWFLQWQHLWVIGLVVLLCYAFAYHLTSPVRRLQETVTSFGQGDLEVRAETKRRDELGQLARTFNEMADRIHTLLKAERRLLQDISHELRSPLARLGVAVELARSGSTGPPMFDRIEREAERLNTLVGELIQVTRAEGDPSQQKRDPVQLDQVLADLVYDSEIEAAAKDCRLALTTVPAVMVLGDEELLRRAVENVLRNAIRYAPAHSTVEIELAAQGAIAQVRVRDYGPGVPAESLTRIFDAFYRVDSDRNRGSGGVGLGLAIARRAIELHKGKLHAENANPGLLVIIDLPREPGSEHPVGATDRHSTIA